LLSIWAKARTVQTWEREIGLPVRRPPTRESGIVLAPSDELDACLLSECENGGRSELEAIRKQLATLKAENDLLRAQLRSLQSVTTLARSNSFADLADWMNEGLHTRCSRVVQRNGEIRVDSAHLTEQMRDLLELCKMRRQQAIDPTPPSTIH